MMFNLSVGAMASNRSIIESYANKMGWDVERATAALTAYGTGLYLPTLDEVKAISNLPDFENEWRLALYAYHILELGRAGHDLSAIAKPETVSQWARAKRLLKPVSRRRIKELFGVDVDEVPVGRQFFYKNELRPEVHYDARRGLLHVGRYVWNLTQIHEKSFVVRSSDQKTLLDLDAELRMHGIALHLSGEFIRAEIPATNVSIYYAKP